MHLTLHHSADKTTNSEIFNTFFTTLHYCCHDRVWQNTKHFNLQQHVLVYSDFVTCSCYIFVFKITFSDATQLLVMLLD